VIEEKSIENFFEVVEENCTECGFAEGLSRASECGGQHIEFFQVSVDVLDDGTLILDELVVERHERSGWLDHWADQLVSKEATIREQLDTLAEHPATDGTKAVVGCGKNEVSCECRKIESEEKRQTLVVVVTRVTNAGPDDEAVAVADKEEGHKVASFVPAVEVLLVEGGAADANSGAIDDADDLVTDEELVLEVGDVRSREGGSEGVVEDVHGGGDDAVGRGGAQVAEESGEKGEPGIVVEPGEVEADLVEGKEASAEWKTMSNGSNDGVEEGEGDAGELVGVGVDTADEGRDDGVDTQAVRCRAAGSCSAALEQQGTELRDSGREEDDC
jgi:hypothetical protein